MQLRKDQSQCPLTEYSKLGYRILNAFFNLPARDDALSRSIIPLIAMFFFLKTGIHREAKNFRKTLILLEICL